MWIIFKVFIELAVILFLFYVLAFWPQGRWDLRSPVRDRTVTVLIGRRSLNNWTATEVPTFMLLLPHIIWTTVLLFPESCPTISGCLSFPELWSLSLPLNKAPEFRLGLPCSLTPLVQKLLLGRSWGGYRPHFLCHLFLGHQVLWFVLSNAHKLLFHMCVCVCVCVCVLCIICIYMLWTIRGSCHSRDAIQALTVP